MKREFFSGQARAIFGLTVTFKNDAGDLLTLHEPGEPRETLRRLCAQALLKDETFRVISISSPESIARDLHGRQRNSEERNQGSFRPATQESRQLGKAGLRWMLHPSLEPSESDPKKAA